MNSSTKKHVIGLVEPVTRFSIQLPEHIKAVEIRLDEIQIDVLRKRGIRVLVVGGNSSSLRSLLQGLRAAMPNITILALTDDLDRDNILFYRNHVDGLFSLPADNNSFFAAISHVVETASGNRLGVFWNVIKNGVFIPATLLLFWWVAVALFKPAPYLLPSPEKVLLALSSNASSFLSHLLVTASEAILGFLIGNGAGIAIAIILHRFTKLQGFTMPVLISFQAIPIVALAPLLAVWLGTGLLSKIAMAAIICFFPMVVNALNAFSNLDRDYVELFEFYRAKYPAKLRMLLLPASFTALVAALKISAGLAVVGAIVAELTGADKGLGYLLLNASYRLETDIMFVAMLLSGFLGIIFFHMPVLLRFVVPRSWTTGAL